jgi:hypothetical protein
MMDEEWTPLVALLAASHWTAHEAALIVAGLDPRSDLFPDQGEPRAIWLPASIPARWIGLGSDCIARRAVKRIQVAEGRLYGLPSPMTPYAWLAEAERRGAAPPWLAASRAKRGLLQYLPPATIKSAQSRRGKVRHADGRWTGAREAARGMWEAWVLGEAAHDDKAAFISSVAASISAADSINESLIGEWISKWEVEWFEPYGRITRADTPESRGYGGHATTAPAKQKKVRRVKVEVTSDTLATSERILRHHKATH